eukprot:m.203359 g.203359  ORF g.203359 m.203359 type:complete len:112 (+) comp39621_c2_seq18:967-1302(+)
MKSSPAQRLFSRRTRTVLPISDALLKPSVVKDADKAIAATKAKQEDQYNHAAKDLPELKKGGKVYIELFGPYREWKQGKVIKVLPYRSYEVRAVGGAVYRRNRRQLRKAVC